jgi:flagellar protein FliS
MFGTLSSGANAYAKVSVETGVTSASPHQLIVMLFDGALMAVSNAASQMKAGNIAGKGQSISKAISIIENGLRASLDKKAGGSIAGNLDALYEYMCNRLLQANLKNQPEMLDEIQGLLKDLKQSWESIGDTPASANAAAPAETAIPVSAAPQPSPYDSLTPHSARLVKA